MTEPKYLTALPRRVREIENVWIPMSDGARLAARVWMPEDAERQPVPAVLEYIPYRKRDFTARRDSINHPYMTAHGYACVRVDLRGSGDSDGVLTDEYGEQEHRDGIEVLRWIAAQPWCTGDVGMIGISWGGINALQLAALAPPELKAVISVCATDDRYADDIHHMGGCLLGDNLSWASVMFSYNALPPDADIVGERWREMWRARLEGSGLWLDTWLRHQRRDDYWKHGSVCEDYGAIECPVMAVSGWADGYSNAVFRLLTHLKSPCKGLVGPWSHAYPHLAEPGPAIGFLQEALRWWDKWLRGIDNGVMDEPKLRVWMQDSVPPTTRYAHRPGRWVAEPAWPSPNIKEQSYVLEPGRLVPAPEIANTEPMTIQSPLTVGLFAGKWCSYAQGPDLAHDQRQEDGGALVFDSPPLAEPLEILGAPAVELEVASDKPIAIVAVRLSDVAPDGKATRVTYGLLNLTHRESSETPELLEPGRRYRVTAKLNNAAQAFSQGHRLRIAISTSYWPLAWPAPEPVRLTVFSGSSTLRLPTRRPRAEDEALRAFEDPVGARPLDRTMLEPEHHNWLVHRDLATDESTLEVINDRGHYRLEDIGLAISHKTVERYTSRADDFTSAKGDTSTTCRLQRGDWSVTVVTRTVLTSTASAFHVRADLDAFDGDKRFYCRSWDRTVHRDFV